jgi:hypothetical protein
MQIPLYGSGRGIYNMLVVAMPAGASDLKLGFIGGTIQRLPVTSPFVWTGSPRQIPAYVGITLANGKAVECMPGVLIDPADLPTATRGDASGPWSCFSP